MDKLHERVLLIESDPRITRLVMLELAEARHAAFEIICAATLAEGLEQLKQGGFKVVLLNLWLLDSQGIKTFEALYQEVHDIPILILSIMDQEFSARQAIQLGAQDYFLINQIDGHSLAHALHNVIARKIVEDVLRSEQERAQVTLDSIGDAVISTDITGNVTYLNQVAERLTGWSREEATGRKMTDVLKIFDSITREPVHTPIEIVLQENKPVSLRVNSMLRRRDGDEIPIEDSFAPIHDRSGHIIGAVMVFHDVSEARAMVLKMSRQAQYDYLTDLPNRLLFNDRIKQAITVAERQKSKLAVLFLDLDLFKNINDSLGHLIGDKLLQSVAERLQNCVRKSDTVCRQGGDEFVILLSDLQQHNDAAIRAKNILNAMAKHHSIDGHELYINMCIGISVYPNDGDNAETLIKNADLAMYQAKKNGRNNYQFFKQDKNDQIIEQQPMEGDLQRALIDNELVLHYQPIVNLETGAIFGTEALIRWRHPTRGLLLPDIIFPIAEESSLIIAIGRWVLHEACTQLRHWLDAGFTPGPMAINISATEFRDQHFLDGVRDIIAETGLENGHLELELTESLLMRDVVSTTSALQVLRKMGVHLSIDDFGMGNSSLIHLKRFPIDTLKIAQSLVCDITTEEDDATIVSTVIDMGNSLNKRICAEGIETLQQLEFLKTKQCAIGQGYYFSQAVDAQEYTKLLASGIVKPAKRFKHPARTLSFNSVES